MITKNLRTSISATSQLRLSSACATSTTTITCSTTWSHKTFCWPKMDTSALRRKKASKSGKPKTTELWRQNFSITTKTKMRTWFIRYHSHLHRLTQLPEVHHAECRERLPWTDCQLPVTRGRMRPVIRRNLWNAENEQQRPVQRKWRKETYEQEAKYEEGNWCTHANN